MDRKENASILLNGRTVKTDRLTKGNGFIEMETT